MNGFASGPEHRNGDVVQKPLPSDILEAQLPDFDEEPVSVGLLIERISQQVYKDLATLTEVLPSMKDAERKYAILEFVGHAGRRLMRLAALIRWSINSAALRKCTNIAGFLQNQYNQFEVIVQELVNVQNSLMGARVRNFDVPTAVDILHTGTYQSLPRVLETFAASDRTTKAETLALLKELNVVIKRRLAIHEQLPSKMRHYKVASGRTRFTIPRHYSATLTVASSDPRDRWFLLDVQFISGDSQEDVYELAGPLVESIVKSGNNILAKAHQEHDATQSHQGLPRVHDYLVTLSLHFKLERLFSQAVKLSQELKFRGNIKVEMGRERTEFQVFYWIDSGIKPQEKSIGPPEPSSLRIMVERVKEETAVEKLLRSLESEDNAQARHYHCQLRQIWSPKNIQIPQEALQATNPQDHSFEAIFRDILARHIDTLMRALYNQIMKHGSFSEQQIKPQMSEAYATSLSVRLHDNIQVLITIQIASGRIEFTLEGDESNADIESRISKAGKAANESRDSVADTLVRLRAGIVADIVEAKVTYLGLRTLRRPPFRPADISQFGHNSYPLLIYLPGFSSKFMVIVIGESQFLFSLISISTVIENQQSFFKIDDLGWLSVAQIDISREKQALLSANLVQVYRYCIARVAFHTLERQLYSRQVPYIFVQDSTSPSRNGLCIPVSQILPQNYASTIHKYCFIRLHSEKDGQVTSIMFLLKFRSPSPAGSARLPSHTSFNRDTDFLTTLSHFIKSTIDFK